MGQEKHYNGKLLIFLLVVILAGVIGTLLLMTSLQKVNTLDGVLTVRVNAQGEMQNLQCWANPQDGNYYVFLPADATSVTLCAGNGQTVTAQGLDGAIAVEALRMSTPYPCSVAKKNGNTTQGNLVFMQSANIPALFISTPSGSLDYLHANKNNTETGVFSIWGQDPASGVIKEFGGRGNTSWDCDKKGYKLVFPEAVSLLGLEEAQNYVLIANARCNYLSNNIAFYLEEQIGIVYVNRSAFIDLYVNGAYLGNYVLCEPIYVGENGIAIGDLEQENFAVNPGISTKDLNAYRSTDGLSKGVLWKNEPTTISGGYLLERDVAEYYAEEKSGFVLSSGDHFVIKSPKHASQNQVEYISEYLQETYDAISAPNGIHPVTGKHFTEYMDLESFALKYALEEFLNFNDAGRSSAYYYKDENGLLCAGPGWDFEGAFLKSAEQLTYLNSTRYSTDWYEKLWKHEVFRSAVIAVYNEKLISAIENVISTWMPQTVEHISASAQMDMVRWGREDFATDCNEIVAWMQNRVAFLDKMWNSGDEFVTVTICDDWANKEYLYLAPNAVLTKELLSQFYTDENMPTYFLTANDEIITEVGVPALEDMTIVPVYAVPPRSTVGVLMGYAVQLLPELVFAAVFFIAVLCYLGKLKQRRNRR